MRQVHRSILLAIVHVFTILLLAACGSSSETNSAKQEAAGMEQVHQNDNGESNHEGSGATSSADAGDHADGEADINHDAGDDHASDDPMAVAMAHDIPEEDAAVPNPIPYDEDSVAIGAELFSQTCSVCHGPEGNGDGPGAAGLDPKPASLTADHVQANSDGALFYTISNGRPGTAMVSWSATYGETERWHLVNFVRSLVAE